MEETTIRKHIAGRLKELRQYRGLSQSALAKPIGITFQQIRKYEQAEDRIASDRLYQFAQILAVETAYFYEGLTEPPRHVALPTRASMRLAERFERIPSRQTRDALKTLIFSLTDSDKTSTIK